MYYSQEQNAKINITFSRFFYSDEITINQQTGEIIAMYRGDWSESGKDRAINIYYNPMVRYQAIPKKSIFWDYSEEQLKQHSIFNHCLDDCKRRRVGDNREW